MGRMDDKEYVFQITDYRGKGVVFARSKLEEKCSDHPELNKESFIACIKRALTEPDEVWEDYNDRKRRRCYYKKYSSISYAKAVVFIADSPCRIVTAYEISYVKETKYPDLKRVR
jgi:hypothetical protein